MCNRIKGVMVSHDYKRGFVTLIRIRCEMWSCPDCGPINAIRWRAYLLKRFNQEGMRERKWVFATITAEKRAHKAGPIATLKNLQGAWKRLYDRMLRRYGKFQYVRVFEQHKSGRYHMHILLDIGAQYDKHEFAILDKLDEFRHPECKWLRNACASLGAGWRVHMRRVWEAKTRTANVGLVVGYIMKYMSKNMAIIEFPKHQRRIQTSRAIGSPNTDAKGRGTWEHAREVPLSILRNEKPVLDMSTGEVLTADSFEGEGYYPPLRYYRGGKEPSL